MMNVLPGERTPPATKAAVVLVVALTVASLVAAALLARPALAATFTVDRTDDPNPTTARACTAAPNDCSLRGAIVAANAAAGADAITVPAGTYSLTRAGTNEDAASTGDLDVTGTTTINGVGTRTTTVDGADLDRIFTILEGATARISGLTITNGSSTTTGGGIQNVGGTLTLDEVAVTANTAKVAGGIASREGTLNIADSTVSGNQASLGFGGIFQADGNANITNSTVSGNRPGDSGGVAVSGATVNIRSSTIASNTSTDPGGGIFTSGGDTVVNVKNTIVSNNATTNCGNFSGGTITSQGNNISSDASCPFTQPSDKPNTDPLLIPLANNGGPTNTHALSTGSPAVNSGSNAGCPATDQRGVRRPQRSICEIGAFERRNGLPVARNDTFDAREDAIFARRAPGVLANDNDPDGDALRATVISRPRKGLLFLSADGSFVYRPGPNLNGADSFSYRASDRHGGTDTATVTIRLASINDAPVVTPISPAPNTSTRDRTPPIKARARDTETNLAESNLRLFVDGRAVPASRSAYDRTTDVLSHTPQATLGLGKHTVRVEARDAEGRRTTEVWEFRVV